ncbi:phage-related integrase [Geothrix rubra]|uniref:Phage-related integrase n=1 Tax=Geothrix rubra TaxID=2927977 RepID=A0ABQ5QA05_9BACT|nr:site-specific integrase [Geothrix rubra]GLH71311.1 phage-related integrase [Geothrix rubra]
MAQRKRLAKIDSPTARATLEPRKTPYWRPLSLGRAIGYAKGKRGGSWVAMAHIKQAKPARRQMVLGVADDQLPADGLQVLSYDQAFKKALTWFEDELRRAKGLDVPTGPFTIADACKDYLADFELRSKKSLQSTRATIQAHILPRLGKIEVNDLSSTRIEKWLAELVSLPPRVRTRKGAPQQYKEPRNDEESRRRRMCTCNRVYTILKAILNRAYQRGHASSDRAWKAVKAFRKVESARINHLEPVDQIRLVNACPPGLKELVQAALLTGARYGELARFQVRDFSRSSQSLFVEYAKSMKPRHIPLTEEGMAFFEALTAGRKGNEPLLVKANGEPWGKNHHVRVLEEVFEQAKIRPVLTFHELRHTYAVTLLRAGVDLPAVAKLLGHADTRMVEKHYGHFTPDWAASVLRDKVKRLGIAGGEKLASLKIQGA